MDKTNNKETRMKENSQLNPSIHPSIHLYRLEKTQSHSLLGPVEFFGWGAGRGSGNGIRGRRQKATVDVEVRLG